MVDADREVGDNHEDYSSGDKVAADLEFPEAGEKRKRQNNSENSSDDKIVDDDLEDDNGDGDNSENGDDSDEANGDNSENGDDSDEENGDDSDEASDHDCDCPERGKKKSVWLCPDEVLLEYFDADGPEKERLRKKLVEKIFPVLRKYLEQAHLSNGFDIEDWPGNIWGLTPIVPLEVCQKLGSTYVESTEVYENLCKLALEKFNRKNGTAYMDAKFVKVNLQTSAYVVYYLTFTAVDPDTSNACASEPTRHTFQSQISLRLLGNNKPVVKLCRLKPGQ